ncbi:MlaD family protein [Nocardia farcinica]|uniref:MlaD family protein n=1 Tax=Nocardia farcinica TaxID=37329 RepID=UPI001894BA84|nr:MlaD family protein [Nocardia farcinica]MBF6183637.1 MCE family protein [Nocardia farcinica]MBF6406698.1 MCE family protein [Nocardia farcinica]MBF6520286.1 MCE family protein [Nocardia farcinica]
MTRGMWASLAAVGAVLVLGVTYLTVAVAQVDPFRRHTEVTMVLARSAGLATGSPVLLRGIDIGRVGGLDYTAAGVEVRLELTGSPRIPVDSSVRIESLSALGEPYIDFRPAHSDGPFLRDGDRLSTEQVAEPRSLAQAARAMARLLDEVDPAVLASLTATVDDAFAGLAAVTPELSRATELLAATLLARLPAIRRLLADVQDMGADMSWFEPSTTESAPLWTLFAQRFSEIVDSLAAVSDVGDTPAMYLEGDGLVPVLGRATAWLEDVGPELAGLAPVVAPLAEGTAPFDIGALISHALSAVGPEGTVHLQITLK